MASPGKASPVRTGLKKRLVYCPLFHILSLLCIFMFCVQSSVYWHCTWSCCMLVWCPRACIAQCLLLFGRLCVSPLRRPAPRPMSPQRTPERSRSLCPHPRPHWHGNGSEPPSWTHPQRYCHLWTCLWAHAAWVSLTAGNQERGGHKRKWDKWGKHTVSLSCCSTVTIIERTQMFITQLLQPRTSHQSQSRSYLWPDNCKCWHNINKNKNTNAQANV